MASKHAKIEQSRLDRKELNRRLVEKTATFGTLSDIESRAFADGVLSRASKELMALAVSIVTKCEPCIEWHTEQAIKAGASESAFYEAIDVAIEMGGGPSGVFSRFAVRAYDYYTKPGASR